MRSGDRLRIPTLRVLGRVWEHSIVLEKYRTYFAFMSKGRHTRDDLSRRPSSWSLPVVVYTKRLAAAAGLAFYFFFPSSVATNSFTSSTHDATCCRNLDFV